MRGDGQKGRAPCAIAQDIRVSAPLRPPKNASRSQGRITGTGLNFGDGFPKTSTW